MLKRFIFIILLLTSCYNDTENYLVYKRFIKEYSLDVKHIDFKLKNSDNIIEATIQDKVKKLLSEKKFKSNGTNNLFKIYFEEIILGNEIVNKNRIFTFTVSLKLEAYVEKDVIFPSRESRYKIFLTRSIPSNSTVEVQAKFLDNLSYELGYMLSDEIDSNFRQNFAKFILN